MELADERHGDGSVTVVSAGDDSTEMRPVGYKKEPVFQNHNFVVVRRSIRSWLVLRFSADRVADRAVDVLQQCDPWNSRFVRIAPMQPKS